MRGALLNRVPALIYGTTGKRSQTQTLVKQAITTGLRAFDCAIPLEAYAKEQVGFDLRAAIGDRGISRQELWLQTRLTSRLSPDASAAAQVKVAIEDSLQSSSTDEGETFLDAFLLGVTPQDSPSIQELWHIITPYVPHKIRMLGLRDVSMEQVDTLYQAAEVKPVIIQNRFDAENGYDQRLRLYCRDKGIAYQCYGVLTDNEHILQGGPVQDLSAKTGIQAEAAFCGLLAIGLNVSVLNETTDVTTVQDQLAALDKIRSWRNDNRNAWMSLLSGFKGSLSRGRVL